MAKSKNKEAGAEKDEMSFLDHLDVLRGHIFRSAASVLVFAVIFFLMGKTVFENIIFAPKNPDFVSYRFFCWISKATCLQDPNLTLIRKDLGEEFFVHLKVSVILGIAIAMPYIFWEIWKFIKPGLYDNERKHATGFVTVSSLLFSVGMLFGFFIIAPFAISFLSNYSVTVDDVSSTATLSNYVSYLIMFTFPSGLVFQLPVVVYFLSKIGLVTADFLKTYRRHAIVVLLIISAIITPPDIVSQVLIGIPLMVLYEISIFIAKRVEKNQSKAEDA